AAGKEERDDDSDRGADCASRAGAHSFCGLGGGGGEQVPPAEGDVGLQHRRERGGSAAIPRGAGGYGGAALGALLAVQGGGGRWGAGSGDVRLLRERAWAGVDDGGGGGGEPEDGALGRGYRGGLG